MSTQYESPGMPRGGRPEPRPSNSVQPRAASRGHVLVVEDEENARIVMRPLLEDAGYDVSFAENGRDALWRLFSETLPDIIVLDLRMPVMDGWQFRAIQKKDPRLGLIPVLAVSADASAKAASISAQAYLPKPLDADELLYTIERVLRETERQKTVLHDEAERLAALSRLAAGVGHEINNPLAFVLLNLDLALEQARPSLKATPDELAPEVELRELKAHLAEVSELLACCQVGGKRIREIVGSLQLLSRQGEEYRGPLDVNKLVEQSLAMVWNQIEPRARLVKNFGELPQIRGNGTALGQVFLNLLVNAAHAIPEGAANSNEIRVSTWVEASKHGPELVVEIRDSGQGMAPGVVSHVFEPFFTTKPVGQGTGLGLPISLQTVSEHRGRISVESEPGRGSVFRVFLPVGESILPQPFAPPPPAEVASARGRILVIDDEPMMGSVIRSVLKQEHDTVVVQSATEALRLLECGEVFDMVLCDLAMPGVSGPEFYARVALSWPSLLPSLVLMTGGASTPAAVAFLLTVSTPVLSKPFDLDVLKRMISSHLRAERGAARAD